MCEYCGCQQNEVIAELTAEHDRLRELSHDLSAAVTAADLPAAARLAVAMRIVLSPHTEVEEAALFPALAADFGDQLAKLVDEHRVIDSALGDLQRGRTAPGWQLRTHLAIAHLFDHILKEQDGVFPAAIISLDADQWETVERVRHRVGSRLGGRIPQAHPV
jgi:hemerythrin-like domain-containing protein